MAVAKLQPQVTGNAGLYYVAYRLSLLAWNVMPTARNARGMDLIAYDSTGKDFRGIQVKALSRRSAVPLGTDLENIMGDWWVIVINVRTEPLAFVMRPEEIKNRSTRDKGGPRAYWLSARGYDDPKFRDAWLRIGRGDDALELARAGSNPARGAPDRG